MQGRQSMENAGGEGEGEGNTQGRSLGLVQLSRGRAAEEECNTCGQQARILLRGFAGGPGHGPQHRRGSFSLSLSLNQQGAAGRHGGRPARLSGLFSYAHLFFRDGWTEVCSEQAARCGQ